MPTPNYYEAVRVGLNGELQRFKVLDENGNYVPGALFHTEREAVDYINEANGWGEFSGQAASDSETPDTPIRVHANVSLYGTLEMHVQLADTSGVYGGTEAEGIALSLTAADADRLRVQLDALLTMYDRHSITPGDILNAGREDRETR